MDQVKWTRRRFLRRAVVLGLGICALGASAVETAKATVAAPAPAVLAAPPVLAKYCYDCHADGENKGGVAFDGYKSDAELYADRELWFKVLKNVRAGVMPPQKKPQPSAADKAQLAEWIKRGPFGIDPNHPDSGRVTLRRLNRVEYRNTIRDLMGIEFNASEEFPPDDTGYGFDTIADVLTVSPLLLEKYMQAAEQIIDKAVPTVSKVVAETTIPGKDFRTTGGAAAPDRMSLYKEIAVAAPFKAEQQGSYKLTLNFAVRGDFDFDPGRANIVLKVDDKEVWSDEKGWDDGTKQAIEVRQQWKPGVHRLSVEVQPITPLAEKRTAVDLQIASLRVEGPLEEQFWTAPKGYHKFFPRDAAPQGQADRERYAREVLGAFATRAFRRPVDQRTLDRLVTLAVTSYNQPGKNFEQGVARAMVAVLASPRFLFRVEESAPGQGGEPYSPVDEYALASRLSYFLWSTMPDEELMSLASRGELRKNLAAQTKRLIDDPRSRAFIDNFTGQWLQARDVEGISIDARLVLARDNGEEKQQQKELDDFRQRIAELQALQAKQAELAAAGAQVQGPPPPPGAPTAKQFNRQRRFRQPAVELDGPLRQAMRLEPEMMFADIVRQDRSVAELLDSDSTFLNDRLAKLYGVPGVSGNEMRRVTLPKDSPRGGLITMGSVLVVTSNPTRTSPVKRGQFILENILGMPTPPPPADVPALEESEKNLGDHEPTVREALQIHRDQALCRSCHARMDPLGFSLENFNPMGMWREKERGQKIDASGQLITGESFHDVRDLKKILLEKHRTDFYRCLTEKVLTYALGRGLEYYDVETVDRIVDRLEKNDGRFSSLLSGVIESAPFQERRNRPPAANSGAPAAKGVQTREQQP